MTNPATVINIGIPTVTKIGKVMPGLRMALVGGISGPDLPTTMFILGKAMQEFKGIGLDVTDPEPLPINNILRKKNNVIITNHTAGLSEFNRYRSVELVFNNIKRYFAKRPLMNVVDKKKGY